MFNIFVDTDGLLQSRIIVIKLNTGTMRVKSFYRSPVESDEDRLPMSLQLQ
jgi:hypothetical protein